MRALRIDAAPVQLALPDAGGDDPLQRWWELPETTRVAVLALLARLIARGVLVAGEAGSGTGSGEAGDG